MIEQVLVWLAWVLAAGVSILAASALLDRTRYRKSLASTAVYAVGFIALWIGLVGLSFGGLIIWPFMTILRRYGENAAWWSGLAFVALVFGYALYYEHRVKRQSLDRR